MRKYQAALVGLLASFVCINYANASVVPFSFGGGVSSTDTFESDSGGETSFNFGGGLSYTQSFILPGQIGVSSSLLLLTFETQLRTMTTYTGTGPDITGTSITSLGINSLSLFRNGSPVDGEESGDGNAAVSVIFCGTACTLADSSLLQVGFVDVFFPGDELLINMVLGYGTNGSASEPGTYFDSQKIEYSFSLRGDGEYTVSPVPLPPAIWLFLSAFALLGVRLHLTRRYI